MSGTKPNKIKLEAEIAGDPGFGVFLKKSGIYPKLGSVNKVSKKSKKEE